MPDDNRKRLINDRYQAKNSPPQFPGDLSVRQYTLLGPDQIYDLLKFCSSRSKEAANLLLNRLQTCKTWTITSTAKEGGTKEHDKLHITMRIGDKRQFHLYVKKYHSSNFILKYMTREVDGVIKRDVGCFRDKNNEMI